MTGKTRYDLDRSAHAVFSLYYHIIILLVFKDAPFCMGVECGI